MSILKYPLHSLHVLSDGVEVKIVHQSEIPAAYWAKYESAWAINCKPSGGSWYNFDSLPRDAANSMAGSVRRSGLGDTEVEYHAAIPTRYLVSNEPEWGELSP